MTGRLEEPVRLPGMISMDLEHETLRTRGVTVPLQILVDGGGLEPGKGRGRVSPGLRGPHGRSGSAEARQRQRTRDWLEGKVGSRPGQRVRSASAGRDKRTEMAARYWAVLFENLRRAVDDLYRTCEGDESCIAAREVVMVLENYTKEFSDLINWLKLKTEYENTPQPKRPTSLAWDIRKTSPLGRGCSNTTNSGKLTPTRPLLLASPAKRQLNFDMEKEGSGLRGCKEGGAAPAATAARSRTVSETIKEVGPGLESEYSPHTSSCSLTREEQESEHEKSDSEQEKDATSPVTGAVVDILTQVVVDAVEESATPGVTPEKKSKKSDDPPAAKTKKAKVRCSKVSPAVVCLATARKEVAADKSKPTAKPSVQSAATAKLAVSSAAVSAAKPNQVQSATPSKPTAPAAAKPSNAPAASQSTVAAKVSTTAPAAKTPAPGATTKPTTFASTVRNSLQTKPCPSGGGSVALTRTNPRLTRSVTTITPSPKPRVPARKTAAGLLITATPRPLKAPPPAKIPAPAARPSTAPPPGAGSPKQQRISLVARQAKFAIQNQNPNRPNTRRVPHADKGKEPGGEIEKGEECGAACHHGSATSLSSCSSGRSWADCVRGGPGQRREAGLALHCSAEDLGAGGDRRKEVDSEGWCTVARRTRARVSPGQGAGKGARRSKYSAATRYRLPSSAMSMPSLALGYVQGDQEEQEVTSARPHLEKSNSSASMAGREAREGGNTALGEVGEEELPDSTDPCAFIKKKKDEINHSKQKALKSLSGEGEEECKAKVEKSSSCPLAVTVEVHRAATPEPPQPSLEVTPPSRIPDPEAEEREMAIAIAEMELSDLRRAVTETEQAELTDTDGDNDCGTDTDNYTTDTDTNDTRSEAGTTSDITSRYEALLEGLSWAEQLELEEQLGDPSTLEARLPGRAIQLHEKLSSPARKKEPHETFLHYQEKQSRARARRLRFGEEKAHRLAMLNTRIVEVMEQHYKLVDERKDTIDMKLRRAEENRIQFIESIRKKAHEEEEKLKEIAFINSLQAANARMDMITQVETSDQQCEERLAEIAVERAKKAELRRKGAEEAEERRKALEESRQKQIDLMVSRRREKEERIQEVQASQREQRKVSAAIKDRERLERLSTVRAAESNMKEELQEKIQQKQEEAAKRHAEHLEHIQQKAWELSLAKCSSDQGVPVIKPYTVKKKCKVCNVLIKSEVHLLSHLRGKQHETAIGADLSLEERARINLANITDAPEGEADPEGVAAKERVRAAKRRARKLKARMAVKGAEYEAGLAPANKHQGSPHRARIGKSLREVEKLLGGQGKGAWPNNSVAALERAFGEILRSLDKASEQDQDVFRCLDGFETVWRIYQMLGESKGENTCVIPLKSLVSLGRVVCRAVQGHTANTLHLLQSNRLALVADILLDRLVRLEGMGELDAGLGPDTDPLSASLMVLLSSAIQQLSSCEVAAGQEVRARLQDLVSYIVCSGTVDSLAGYFQLVRDPIDSSPEVAQFLLTSLQLLTSLTAAVEAGEDKTHLLVTLQGTELAGTVSMLYGMLLHQGRDSDRSESPVSLPEHTLAVVTATCTLLHRLLVRDPACVSLMQGVLGQEGISLEFRHIASYLLYYCQHHSQANLLKQVIVLVGFFTANHRDNQAIVQSGSQPSVLQQLANLPFPYFSQPELRAVLFPTLLSSCHGNSENTAILAQEMSWQLIDDFVKSEEGGRDQLVQLVTGGC